MRTTTRTAARTPWLLFVPLIAVLAMVLPAAASAAGNASYTTVKDGVGGCQNGSGSPNCNLYGLKSQVYMNGGPVGGNGLPDGDYFFAVLTPGAQNGGFMDGADGNLSDTTAGATTGDAGTGDGVANRTFHVTGGTITSYAGTHDTGLDPKGHPVIGLAPFDDTDNPGGVYILAVCQSGATSPDQCKYDAFKVRESEQPCPDDDPDCTPNPPAGDLVVTKDATPTFTRSWSWGVTKDVDKTVVKQIGGSATFHYTVDATVGAPVDSGWKVTGTIEVTNPNDSAVTGVDVSDVLDPNAYGATCSLDNGAGADETIPGMGDGGLVSFTYTCTYPAGANPTGEEHNTATAAWDQQILSDSSALAAGSATGARDFTWDDGTIGNPTESGKCTDVKDTFDGGTAMTLGSACADPAKAYPQTTEYKYQRVIAVPANGCRSYTNTAAVTGATDSETVKVCGPTATGALTIGFWKNTNGNGLIKTYCAPGGKLSLAGYLSGLGGMSGPFAGAAGLSCSQLVTYVNGIIGGASATDMNKMLKAQMLATALDAYFSGPGYTATKVSGVKPPSNFLPNGGIASFDMDVTAICPMVDNTTAGSGTCKAGAPSSNGFASGAFPWAHNTVATILTFAATPGTSPWATGAFTSPTWYGTDRTKQELLKNVFDQINNNLAFAF